jgi:hypothetical protein
VFIEKEWTTVDEFLRMLKKKLDQDMDYQKFTDEYRELKAWILDISTRVKQQPEPINLSEAEAGINLHQGRKTRKEK